MIGINFDNKVGRATLGRNVDVTIEMAACEAFSATWNFGTYSAFALGPRKFTENFGGAGRPQELHGCKSTSSKQS
jgi:hypothetical protein